MNWKDALSKDQRRYSKSGKRGFLKAFQNPGFRFCFWLRLASHFSIWNPIGLVSRIFFKLMQIRFGFQIPHIAKIGGGFYIGHFGNIVISEKAIIGENCNVAQGVTIGRINRGPRKGAPKIGDRVWVGPNSVLSGNITIGNNVLIAPLTFVNIDVPANCMVIGNPAKIIEGKNSVDYINYYS